MIFSFPLWGFLHLYLSGHWWDRLLCIWLFWSPWRCHSIRLLSWMGINRMGCCQLGQKSFVVFHQFLICWNVGRGQGRSCWELLSFASLDACHFEKFWSSQLSRRQEHIYHVRLNGQTKTNIGIYPGVQLWGSQCSPPPGLPCPHMSSIPHGLCHIGYLCRKVRFLIGFWLHFLFYWWQTPCPSILCFSKLIDFI